MALRFTMLLVVALAAPMVWGNSAGAPKEACGDMVPQHQTPPQDSVAPYTISVSTKSTKAGGKVQVTIKGKGAKDLIKGLLVQARVGNEPVGKFEVDPNSKLVQVVDCGTGKTNAVTHRKHDGVADPRSITLTWVSPPNLQEQVKFRATVALNGGVFWVGLLSDAVKIQ